MLIQVKKRLFKLLREVVQQLLFHEVNELQR